MSNKNWILFITAQAYPCKTGGLEVFNHYLINELKNHYPVHILTQCEKMEVADANIHTFKWRRFPKFTQPLAVLYFIFKNRKHIKLLYFSYSKAFWSNWAVYLISKYIFKIKFGFTIHGGGLSKWKPHFIHKLLFKNAAFVTGVSNRIIEEYTKRSNRTIINTPPLIPFNVLKEKNVYRKQWEVEADEVVLLYVGSLKPLKSVDTLIEALGTIPIEILKKYKLKVLIAGDGVSKKELEEKTKELKLEQIVKFLGLVDRSNVNQLYNLANIYTICSEFEGLPISLLEAFANELPSITSDAPGLIDVSLDNKNTVLFKTGNAIDYADKIKLVLSDTKLQTQIKNHAKEFFEKHYTYDIVVNDFRKIIDQVDG